ncbi:nuclear transport factor 2 family protein [Sphingomonas sp. UYAg733]
MFAAFNRHDAAAMAALYADDARLSSSDFCAPRGQRDVVRTYTALFAAFPDIEDRVDDLVVQGDRVAVRFTAVSVASGFRMPIATFLKVRNGKIIADDSYFDAGSKPCEK